MFDLQSNLILSNPVNLRAHGEVKLKKKIDFSFFRNLKSLVLSAHFPLSQCFWKAIFRAENHFFRKQVAGDYASFWDTLPVYR